MARNWNMCVHRKRPQDDTAGPSKVKKNKAPKKKKTPKKKKNTSEKSRKRMLLLLQQGL